MNTIPKKTLLNLLQEKQEPLLLSVSKQDTNLQKPIKLTLLELLVEKKKLADLIKPATIATTLIKEALAVDNSNIKIWASANEKQRQAVMLALSNKDMCLVGCAGTGKTSIVNCIIENLLSANDEAHIFVGAYTNTATNNIANSLSIENRKHSRVKACTIHKLLEFAPEIYYDPILSRKRFRFSPQRDASNKIEQNILIIEEATLISLDLWKLLYNASDRGIQIILLGDLNQLQPVFGPSILNYALLQLPAIELTQVYRQKDDSPILAMAQDIIQGRLSNINATNNQSSLSCILYKAPSLVPLLKLRNNLPRLINTLIAEGKYDPTEDIILSPYNKQELGTIELNKIVATIRDSTVQNEVYEVITGYDKEYYAVGDLVVYNKERAIITSISSNSSYIGMRAQEPSVHLTRWGTREDHLDEAFIEHDTLAILQDSMNYDQIDLDTLLTEETSRRVASHVIEIVFSNGEPKKLENCSDLAPTILSLAYATTVHRSQGLEWNRVIFILHQSHAILLTRELLYTGVTRAKKDLILIAQESTLLKAVKNQRVKGNTLKEKIASFNSNIVMKQNDLKVSKPKLDFKASYS